MNLRSLPIAVIASAGVLIATPVPAAAEPCSSCHDGLMRKRNLHAAMDGGDCSMCHEAVEGEAKCGSGKAWETGSDPDLCFMCHEEPASEGRHQAVEFGCLSCHDPHSSNESSLLRTSVAKTCKGCHDVGSGAVTHSPVADGDCTMCHRPHASPNAKLLAEAGRDLCLQCHDVPTDDSAHMAVTMVECLDCHRPHVSDNASLLSRPAGELCRDCHSVESGAVGSPGSHFPVARGECGGCHQTHKAGAKHLLRIEGTGLCTSCHESDSTRSSKRLSGSETWHMPAEDDCGTCHQPHGGAQPGLQARAHGQVCFDCHEAFDGPFRHSAVRLGKCTGCHDPHNSDLPSFVRRKMPELCFECHSDDLTGRAYVHAPVAEGECGLCHDPHQGRHPQLLPEPTVNATCLNCHDVGLDRPNVHEAVVRFGCSGCHDPHGSVNPFQLHRPINALCASCHEKQHDGLHVFTSSTGKPHPLEGVPDPKRADRELSCTSCHSPHASDNPRLWYAGSDALESCDRCHSSLSGNTKRSAATPPSQSLDTEAIASLPEEVK